MSIKLQYKYRKPDEDSATTMQNGHLYSVPLESETVYVSFHITLQKCK